ncbi:hypothetical protein H2198_005357 [Neophaeococcomyces mojaviensis]|uniref:Uncharacterized protein n=1 Tax=Neophaeococcomyces mojaviensis TaxID=3383035 RepID=A0ACC3A606_9EURO|nr:hypothetical protein H2198_005357 [Knufia sp. JES_112]
MPLHLLGKKSWNVYNQDNIERVQRDEEKARIVQQGEERRRRDDDAADRLRILRGADESQQETSAFDSRSQKRKRNENDDEGTQALSRDSRHDSSRRRSLDVTADPLDQISNMRFRDAAGRNASTPWYSAPKPDALDVPAPTGRDVWGNEDAGRHARDQRRLDASDPLLAMKKGVKQLRDADKQKAEWRKERERDLNEVEKLARREKRRKRDRDRENARGSDRELETGRPVHRGRNRVSDRKHESRSRHRHHGTNREND